MLGLLIGGSIAFAVVVVVLMLAIDFTSDNRERGRKVRRRHLAHASETINAIDTIVARYYPNVDLVGQAMCDEIRTAIHNHRKVITSS